MLVDLCGFFFVKYLSFDLSAPFCLLTLPNHLPILPIYLTYIDIYVNGGGRRSCEACPRSKPQNWDHFCKVVVGRMAGPFWSDVLEWWRSGSVDFCVSSCDTVWEGKQDEDFFGADRLWLAGVVNARPHAGGLELHYYCKFVCADMCWNPCANRCSASQCSASHARFITKSHPIRTHNCELPGPGMFWRLESAVQSPTLE